MATFMLLPLQPAGATFSGSNGRISFVRFIDDANGAEIFSSASDGTDVQQLTDSPGDRVAIFSDWSPDGDTIAFDSDRVDGNLDDVVQIYLMPWNGESHGLTQVTTGDGFHGDPAWSPDGRSLAIESDWANYPADEGIWIIPASAGVARADAQRVTTLPAGYAADSEPQFSPDGHWVVFTRFRSCKLNHTISDNPPGNTHAQVRHALDGCLQAIFKVRSDGSQLTQLTSWGQQHSAPDWSPDGTRITFDSGDVGQLGSSGDIWVMNADGTNQRRVVATQPIHSTSRANGTVNGALANNPVWSPDGTKIMYSQWNASNEVSLDVVNADGSGQAVAVPVPPSGFQNKVDWGTHP